GKFIFAGFEAARPLQIHEIDDAGHEDSPVIDYAVAFEALGNSADALASRDGDHRRSRKRTWLVELHLDPIEAAHKQTGQDKEEGEQAVEHPEEGMLVWLRPVMVGRLRWTDRLECLDWAPGKDRGHLPASRRWAVEILVVVCRSRKIARQRHGNFALRITLTN